MLPDDIEQYLIDGQRTRATLALMKRRKITIDQAREMVAAWFLERSRRVPDRY